MVISFSFIQYSAHGFALWPHVFTHLNKMGHWLYLILRLELKVRHIFNWFLQNLYAEFLLYRGQNVFVLSQIFLLPTLNQVINGLNRSICLVKSGTDIRWSDFEVFFDALNSGEQDFFAWTGGFNCFAHFIEVESKRNLAQFSLFNNRY